MKLPLAVPIDSRDGNGQYDARPVNVLKESSAASESVVKRPAIVKVTGPNTPMNGNGLVDFDGTLISVFGAQPAYARRTYMRSKNVILPVPPTLEEKFANVAFAHDGHSSLLYVPSNADSPALISDDGGNRWKEIASPYSIIDPDLYYFSPASYASKCCSKINGNWVFAFKYTDVLSGDVGIAFCTLVNDFWGYTGDVAVYSGASNVFFSFDSFLGMDLYAQTTRIESGSKIGAAYYSSDYGASWSEIDSDVSSAAGLYKPVKVIGISSSTSFVVPQTNAFGPGDGTCIMTSSDGSEWTYEVDATEDIIFTGGCSYGSVAYLIGTEVSLNESRVLKVTGVAPLIFEKVTFGEFDPDNYLMDIDVHVSAKVLAILSQSGSDDMVYVSFSLNFGKTWETISFNPPSTESPSANKISAVQDDPRGIFKVLGASRWVATIDPFGKKPVSLATLIDHPFDFAQSAL